MKRIHWMSLHKLSLSLLKYLEHLSLRVLLLVCFLLHTDLCRGLWWCEVQGTEAKGEIRRAWFYVKHPFPFLEPSQWSLLTFPPPALVLSSCWTFLSHLTWVSWPNEGDGKCKRLCEIVSWQTTAISLAFGNIFSMLISQILIPVSMLAIKNHCLVHTIEIVWDPMNRTEFIWTFQLSLRFSSSSTPSFHSNPA